MANPVQSMMNEAVSAFRGVGALIVGDKTAARHFDLTQAGLVGSFIALLSFLFVQSLLRFAVYGPSGELLRNLAISVGLYGLIIAATLLFLRWIKRADTFVPMLVVQNWVSFFSNIVLTIAVLIGAEPLVFLIGIAAIVVSINILRIISRLTLGQIFGYFAVQLLALMVIAVLYVLIAPPDALMNQLNSQL